MILIMSAKPSAPTEDDNQDLYRKLVPRLLFPGGGGREMEEPGNEVACMVMSASLALALARAASQVNSQRTIALFKHRRDSIREAEVP